MSVPLRRQGFDKYGFDKYGYSKFGWHRDGYDRDGYDKYGFGRYVRTRRRTSVVAAVVGAPTALSSSVGCKFTVMLCGALTSKNRLLGRIYY